MSEFYPGDIDEICTKLSVAAKAFSGKRILITGGRGFLGRYFGEVFLRLNKIMLNEPCTVIALDNLITSSNKSQEIPDDPNYCYIQHDVIKPFYPERPVDYILHAAGIASPAYYRKFPLETLEVATHGLRNSLDLARKYNAKLLFFSSSEIYGDPDPKEVPTKESYRGNVASMGPRSSYDESKRLGETYCYIYNTLYGVHTNIVRPFNVYGAGMAETDYRVLPNFASRIKRGLPVEVYGSGNQTRTFCYVTDAIAGFLQVLLSGQAGEAYNIGNPYPEVSMLQLVDHVRSAVGEVDIKLMDYPDSYPGDEPNRRCPDLTKAQTHLGYEPTIGLEEGLRRFFEWTNANYSTEEKAAAE